MFFVTHFKLVYGLFVPGLLIALVTGRFRGFKVVQSKLKTLQANDISGVNKFMASGDENTVFSTTYRASR